MKLRLFVAAASTIFVMSAWERAAHAEQPPEEPPPARDAMRTTAAFTLAGGVTSMKLLDLPFIGGHALAGVSAEVSSHFSVGAEVEYVRASSTDGLLMQLGRFDLTPSFVLDRFRLGLGMNLAWLAIRRETGGSAITQLGIGVHARASFDVVRLGARGGLFVSLEPSYDSFGSPALYSWNLALGARF